MSKDNAYFELLRRRKETFLPQVQELPRKGHGPRTISAKLGIPRTTIMDWLRASTWWQDARPARGRARLTRQVVTRYKTIYREAMAEWRASRKGNLPPVEPPAEGAAAGEAATRKRPPRTAGRTANYALLGKAMEALKAIREIKGLDAPRQTEVAGPGGGPIPLSAVKAEDLSRMSNGELFALEARLRAECEPDLEPQGLLPREKGD